MKVAQQIIRRGYLNILPAVGGLAILVGLALYGIDASMMRGAWMGSGTGQALTVGAVAAIAALTLGVHGVRRSMLRAMALGQTLPQTAEGPERQARVAEIERLRARASTSARRWRPCSWSRWPPWRWRATSESAHARQPFAPGYW